MPRFDSSAAHQIQTEGDGTMKKQTTHLDPSMDVLINPVRLSDGTLVPWGVAFPR
jgi:hypothetical protein